MRRTFGIVLLVALSLARSFASDATFSKDGKHVYAIEFASPVDKTPQLFDIDIEKQSASKIDLGPLINNKPIVAVSTSNSGELLVATPQGAWLCNMEKKSCRRLCDAPKGLEFKEMAYNPANGSVLLSTRDELAFNEKPDLNPYRAAFVLEHGEGNLFPVYTGRVEYLDGMAFSPRGDLFFGSRGDLWQGSVGEVDIINKGRKELGKRPLPPQPGEPAQYASLAARRCAPLATLESHRISPAQIGVGKVAIADRLVYLHLHPMYGSGFGAIARLPIPPRWPSEDEDGDSLDERLKLYVNQASSIEAIGYNEDYSSWLCASPDGKRVFFRGALDPGTGRQGYGFYLIENNGKPRELNVKLPE
jgi:hypothetical protein